MDIALKLGQSQNTWSCTEAGAILKTTYMKLFWNWGSFKTTCIMFIETGVISKLLKRSFIETWAIYKSSSFMTVTKVFHYVQT